MTLPQLSSNLPPISVNQLETLNISEQEVSGAHSIISVFDGERKMLILHGDGIQVYLDEPDCYPLERHHPLSPARLLP